jgi:hypothetical protein
VWEAIEKPGGFIFMIERYSFGNIIVKGETYTNDIKIILGKVVPEWWRRSGHFVDVDCKFYIL